MGELKQGWKLVKLGQVAVNSTAATKDHEADGFSRYIIGKHIPEDGGRITTWNPVGDAEFGSRIRTMVRAGDVLCTTRGPKLKVAVAEFDCLAAHTNFILRPKNPSEILPGILEAVTRSAGFQDHLRKHFRGSTNLFVNWSDAAEYEFALPPPDEQYQSLLLLQAYEEAWRRADYLSGCARILFHSMVQHFHEGLAARWPNLPLASLVAQDRPITYGILMPGAHREGGVPVIKVKDFPTGVIDESDLLRTSAEIAAAYKRSELRPNDILVSIRGTIGRIAVVPISLAGANITQDSARLSFRDEILPEFARAMLESATAQRALKSNIPPPAPAGMPPARAKPRDSIQGLNIGELRRVLLPVPPVDLQAKIVESVGQARDALQAAALRTQQFREARAQAIEMCLRGAL